jgi:hypothetical protein
MFFVNSRYPFMNTLSETWFAEGYIDFELKKYTLLAYLQQVNSFFNQNKLYPQLADVIFHYNNIAAFRRNKRFLQEQFPKKLSGVQMQKLELLYEQLIEDDELMTELEDIIQFSAGKIQKTILDGTQIYEFVEEKIMITPVGIVPLDINEGYFFLNSGNESDTLVYHYRLSIFEKHDEKFRSIKTSYVDVWYRSIATTYEHIKMELIRKRTSLPNPAVYAVETPLKYPLEETLLPVAKRSLVKFISSAAA